MNRVILCEGKSDAILISYYLGKVCGWKHNKEEPRRIRFDSEKGEYGYWYKKDEQYLLICGVGGRDNFKIFFENKISKLILLENYFSKLAIVIDKDENETKDLESELKNQLTKLTVDVQNNKWTQNQYNTDGDSVGWQATLEFLLLIIPREKAGALETVLLDSICENREDEIIVTKCKQHVDNMKNECGNKYLNKGRLIQKAYLSSTWAIQTPEKVFDFIDEQIKSVKWENSEVLKNCFEELSKI